MTETASRVSAAMVAAQAEIANIPFDSKNPHFNAKFVSLAGVLAAVRPVLAKHGLTLMQPAYTDAGCISVSTMFLHESGEQVRLPPLSMPLTERMTAQQLGGTVTYLRRYSLTAALGIAGTDEDDDGERDASMRMSSQKPAGGSRTASASGGGAGTSKPSQAATAAPSASNAMPGEMGGAGSVFGVISYLGYKEGTGNTGKPWKVARIGIKPAGATDSVFMSTFDQALQEICEDAKAAGTPVQASFKEGRNGKGLDLIDVIVSGTAMDRETVPAGDDDVPF